MMSSLALVSTIIVLGAPVAIVFIPWAIITGDAKPIYNAPQRVVRTALRFARIRVETNGIDAVPAHTACIFMSNHVSNLDPPALIPRIPGRTAAVIKRSLMKIPVLGFGFKLGEFIPVDRDGKVESAQESIAVARSVMAR